MSDSNLNGSEDERDWEAAKAFFENLKTKKPRPVSNLLNFVRVDTQLSVSLMPVFLVLCCVVMP